MRWAVFVFRANLARLLIVTAGWVAKRLNPTCPACGDPWPIALEPMKFHGRHGCPVDSFPLVTEGAEWVDIREMVNTGRKVTFKTPTNGWVNCGGDQ